MKAKTETCFFQGIFFIHIYSPQGMGAGLCLPLHILNLFHWLLCITLIFNLNEPVDSFLAPALPVFHFEFDAG